MKYMNNMHNALFNLNLIGSYRLESLALTRSGDKADSCNIGVIARHPSLYPYLKEALTSEAVAEYFRHVFPDNVNPLDCVKR